MKKILNQDEMILQCREWKRNARRIVLVSGHFALLHPGHVRLLEQARSYGDVLVVALRSEAGGDGREDLESVAPAAERAEILAALAAVDFVTVFEGASAEGILAGVAPDVVVTGIDDHSVTATGDGDAANANCSPQIVRLPLEPGYSTKLILERIAQLPA